MALAAPALETRGVTLESDLVVNALIIETAFLGDAIISLALARELRRLDSSCRISYLVRPDAADIVRASPDVDEVIVFDKRGAESGIAGVRSKAMKLNAKRFDTLFLVHGSRRSQMLASLLRIPRKVGFDSFSRAGLTHTLSDTGWKNRYERSVLLSSAVSENSNLSSLPSLQCQPTPEIATFCNQFANVVVLAPGSVWKTKKWGDVKYAQLASRLTEQGIGIVIVGGVDAMAAGELAQRSCAPSSVLDLTGRVSFVDSGGAIAASSLLVANDSAPTHLAVAVGTEVLTIFGPTVPAFGFAPPNGSGQTIEVPDLWCRPCASHGSDDCPVYSHDCMVNISVDAIINRVFEMLPVRS